MSNSKGYYEIEISSDNYSIDEAMYLNDIKQRKMFIGDITPENIFDPVRHILQINKEDKDIPTNERKPIFLYISSDGGSVEAGFELIDAICMSKTPVYTINLGNQYSMGFLIGLVGHKRFTMPHSRFLLHDGSNYVWDSGAKAQDRMDFNKKIEDRICDILTKYTKITRSEYEDNYRIEWYMFADEAKEKGVVDYIIGKDCDIDDII